MTVQSEVRTITPEDASAILESNSNNRTVRNLKVQTYANDMRVGKWKLNGESIKFNGDGTLYDGQHRLLACVVAGKPFETFVVTGLTPTSHATLDVGMTRTLGDELRWQGEKDVNTLASVLNLLAFYEGGIGNRVTPTRQEALLLLRKRPQIRDAHRATPISRHTGIMQSSLLTGVVLMDSEHGSEKTNEFLSELDSGTGYVEGDPCLALRNYAMNVASQRMLRPGRVEWLAVVIKTMNAWLLSREMIQVRWRRTGTKKESFPTLITSEMADS